MATHRVSWPDDGDYTEECAAYCDGANAHYAATYEPGGQFTFPVLDAHDQWNCHYYGPPFEFDHTVVQEPPEVAALRPNGTVMPNWDPPEDD